MRIAYFINQYPKISHTFIRREILQMEQASGEAIYRYAARGNPEALVEESDRLEVQKTTYLVDDHKLQLCLSFLIIALVSPIKFLRTFQMVYKTGKGSEAGLLRHIIYLAEACLLRRWLQRDKIDHIHAHFGTNPASVLLFCKLLGGPNYSFTVHGPEEFDKPISLSLREKIHHASFVCAISAFGKSQLCRWADYADWHKIKIIHCGLDQHFLAEPVTPISQKGKFVSIGRLCEQKGQMLLLEAVRQLSERHNDFVLTLIGGGEMHEQLNRFVAQHNLQAHVEFAGWQNSDEIKAHLKACHAFVLPSFAEGLPVVIMESLAMARPVITTYIAGIPELVKPGDNGWLVPAGTVTELVEAMEQSLEQSLPQLNSMGENGRQAVLKQHNIEIEAEKLLRYCQAAHRERRHD